VTDSADKRTAAPTRAALSRAAPRRARRFVLPDVHDERTAAQIVAFVDGPAARVRRNGAGSAHSDGPRLPKELDTRTDWTAAFHQEASRHARYGRPASVVLLQLVCRPEGRSLDRAARALADLIRAEARTTDRAVRMGPATFRLLLPETNARAARYAGSRLERGLLAAYAGRADAPELRVEVAAPTRGGSLEEALLEAERRLTG
jgi:hypothetical protein